MSEPRARPSTSYGRATAKDFAPVTFGTVGRPILLVNIDLPVRTLAEFVAYAKARPGQVTYGSPGIGSSQHMAVELLQHLTGIRMVHAPYKSAPQVMTDLMAGQLNAAVEYAAVSAPFVQAGKLRALAIIGPERKPVLPDVQTDSGVRSCSVQVSHLTKPERVLCQDLIVPSAL